MVVAKGPMTGAARLERVIEGVKYTLFWLSTVACVFSVLLFVLTLWMRLEPGFQDWVDALDIGEFYIGIDVLIFVSVLMIVVAVLSAGSSLVEHPLALFVNAGLQGACFLLGLIGCIVLTIFSTHDSLIQPLIWQSMRNMIVNSHRDEVSTTLRLLQENIGCCGADGPMDYHNLLKPLPAECRDTVTGNAFFHGCVDQLTWYLEDRSYWIVVLTLMLCALHVIQGVLSLVLFQAIKKEEEGTSGYNKR